MFTHKVDTIELGQIKTAELYQHLGDRAKLLTNGWLLFFYDKQTDYDFINENFIIVHEV